jgi:hypothetical protein
MAEQQTDNKKDFAEFRALIKDTDARKPGAAGKLRAYLDANLWAKNLGDFMEIVRGALMSKLTKSAANLETLAAHLEERKKNLGYKDASPLEQMLIERIMMSWLRLIAAESYCNQIGNTITSLNEAHFAERRLTMANSRFLRACEALERYRLMVQVTKIAKAKADWLDAKAGEARMNKSNAAMRLLKSATG